MELEADFSSFRHARADPLILEQCVEADTDVKNEGRKGKRESET